MAVTIVQLGQKRRAGEGVRIGTVRRPPRGVPKAEWAKRDYFDVWLPNLAPSEALVKAALSAQTDAQWRTFTRRYIAEMKTPEKARVLDTLAALSHHASFSVGCYCEKEARCHRSVLRQLLLERGAAVKP
jgi:uncharacterized protein YeaO (DUF488 family)